MDELAEKREKVRALDAELLRVLQARMALTDGIAPLKKSQGMPVYDPAREMETVETVRSLAAELGISPPMAEALIRTIMAESRLRQDSSGKAVADSDQDRSNIAFSRYIPPPAEFKATVPLSRAASETAESARSDIRDTLDGGAGRVILIMGPCSIHDPVAALEYAERLRKLSEKVQDKIMLVMRTYVEKSRSGSGWTGFLTDPRLDGSGDVQEGITMTRKLLNRLGEMGVPAAVEFINPLTSAYIGDTVSWAAIGARSSGSQIHRDMASGLPMPTGFKNGPDGGAESVIGAVISAARSHDYLGLDDTGSIAAFKTRGNAHCHPVLRGGAKPNYDAASVSEMQNAMAAAGLSRKLMVDCSHGNSGKAAENQKAVFMNVIDQIATGNSDIIGLMLESNLNPGRQEPGPGMEYGVSVTDECLGWKETEKLVTEGYRKLG